MSDLKLRKLQRSANPHDRQRLRRELKRRGLTCAPKIVASLAEYAYSTNGNGNGCGNGYGSGYGNGSGNGDGYGNGYSDGGGNGGGG